jgi:hypothetical protein
MSGNSCILNCMTAWKTPFCAKSALKNGAAPGSST